VKHLIGAPFMNGLLPSPRNIKLGWKSLPETNSLAYWAHS
jgi:hypothetical protein